VSVVNHSPGVLVLFQATRMSAHQWTGRDKILRWLWLALLMVRPAHSLLSSISILIGLILCIGSCCVGVIYL